MKVLRCRMYTAMVGTEFAYMYSTCKPPKRKVLPPCAVAIQRTVVANHTACTCTRWWRQIRPTISTDYPTPRPQFWTRGQTLPCCWALMRVNEQLCAPPGTLCDAGSVQPTNPRMRCCPPIVACAVYKLIGPSHMHHRLSSSPRTAPHKDAIE